MAETGHDHDEDDDKEDRQLRGQKGKGKKEPFPSVPKETPINFGDNKAEREAYVASQREDVVRRMQEQATEERRRTSLADTERILVEQYRASRESGDYQFHITQNEDDPADLELNLVDKDGDPLNHSFSEYLSELGTNIKGIQVEDVDAHPKDLIAGEVYVDEKKILRIPSAMVNAPDARVILVPVVVRVVEQATLAKLDAVKKVFEEKKKKLSTEHVSKRFEHFEKAEEQYREAVKHILHERDERVQEIIEKIFEAQHLDITTPLGGREAFLQTRESATRRHLKENFIFSEEKPKTVWGTIKHLPIEYAQHVRVEQQMHETAYAELEKKIQALPKGRWNDFRKSGFMQGKRNLRKAWLQKSQWLETGLRTPVFGSAVVASGVLVAIGKVLSAVFETPWKSVKGFLNEWTHEQAFTEEAGHKGTPKKKPEGGHGH